MSFSSDLPQSMISTALGDLLDQANSRSHEDNRILLMGLADLYEDRARTKPEALTELFLCLARQAETDIRQLLAQRLVRADWAPPALIRQLAHDEIEIARDLILSSPLLKDDDLIDILERATIEHQIHVAQRQALGLGPAIHILHQAQPAVMVALASNSSASLNQACLSALVDQARQITGLRAPLARHHLMDQALAEKLYPWVGESLRQVIASRFRIHAASLAEATNTAVDQALGLGSSLDDEAARLLIDKLQRADQLRPAYLVRAAREGHINLVAHGLATLGQFSLEQVQHALTAQSARPLLLACTAVGLDRAVFGPMLVSIRKHNQGLPRDQDQTDRLASRSRDQAAQEFRSLMNDLGRSSV